MTQSNPPAPASVPAAATESRSAAHGPTRKLTRAEQRAVDAKNRLSSPAASIIAIVIAIVWTIPTAGLLVTSFRPAADIRRTGWWTVFTNPEFSLANYEAVLTGSGDLVQPFVNTIVITLPSVIIPIILALLAAYAFAWIDFKGRDWLFVAVFALQIVPIQVTLIPLLTQYVQFGLVGTYWTVWLSHTIFGLPLAIFLLHNFMREIPASLIEAARVDGAGPWRVAISIQIPLIAPALMLTTVFSIIGTLQLFAEPQVLAKFSPAIDSQYTPNLSAYTTAFAYNDYNVAAAQAVLIALVAFVLSFIFLRVTNRKSS